MKNYEIMFIVRPTLDEATIKKVATDMTEIITSNGGKIVEEVEKGQKELAYEIKDCKSGYYFLLKVECNEKTITEFSRIANVNENVIRHIVIKTDK